MILNIYAKRDSELNVFTNFNCDEKGPEVMKEFVRRSVCLPNVPKGSLAGSMYLFGTIDDVSGKVTTLPEPEFLFELKEFEQLWTLTHPQESEDITHGKA